MVLALPNLRTNLIAWSVQALSLATFLFVLPAIKQNYSHGVFSVWLILNTCLLFAVTVENAVVGHAVRLLSYLSGGSMVYDTTGKLTSVRLTPNEAVSHCLLTFGLVSLVVFFIGFGLSALTLSDEELYIYALHITCFSLVPAILLLASLFKALLIGNGCIEKQRIIQFFIYLFRLLLCLAITWLGLDFIFLVFVYVLSAISELLLYFLASKFDLTTRKVIEGNKFLAILNENWKKSLILKFTLVAASFGSSLLSAASNASDSDAFIVTVRIFFILSAVSLVPLSTRLPKVFSIAVTDSEKAIRCGIQLGSMGIFLYGVLGVVLILLLPTVSPLYFNSLTIDSRALLSIIFLFFLIETLRSASAQILESNNELLFIKPMVAAMIISIAAQYYSTHVLLQVTSQQLFYIQCICQVVLVAWLHPCVLWRRIKGV